MSADSLALLETLDKQQVTVRIGDVRKAKAPMLQIAGDLSLDTNGAQAELLAAFFRRHLQAHFAVEEALVKRCPPELLRDAHHWLILHGRYVCQARKPLCHQCAVAHTCDFQPKTRA